LKKGNQRGARRSPWEERSKYSFAKGRRRVMKLWPWFACHKKGRNGIAQAGVKRGRRKAGRKAFCTSWERKKKSVEVVVKRRTARLNLKRRRAREERVKGSVGVGGLQFRRLGEENWEKM